MAKGILPCRKCGVLFSGRHCKNCTRIRQKAYARANLEKLSARARAWRKANPEKILAAREKNRAHDLETTKAWQAKNPQRFAETCAAYRAANREKCHTASAKWAKENPEAKRIHTQNRYARKRENGGNLSQNLPEKLLKLQRGKCACCGLPLGEDFEMDHIMPISRGGANTDSNIQLLRGKCNRQKLAKHPADFMRERGFLL